MTKINVGIHKDHRQRMKKKIHAHSLKVLDDIQLLEWYLSYTIPYKDTNPLAHQLLNTFGSLANVLEADYASLKLVTGIGHETALFLSSTADFHERYMQSKESDDLLLNTDAKIVKYFKKAVPVTNKEKLYVVCLNAAGKLKMVLSVDGYDESKIIVNVNKLIKDIVVSGAVNIAFMHTHPYGDVEPSKEDEIFTRELIVRCNQLDIRVVGHFIFNEFSHHSMRDYIHDVYDEINGKQ